MRPFFDLITLYGCTLENEQRLLLNGNRMELMWTPPPSPPSPNTFFTFLYSCEDFYQPVHSLPIIAQGHQNRGVKYFGLWLYGLGDLSLFWKEIYIPSRNKILELGISTLGEEGVPGWVPKDMKYYQFLENGSEASSPES